VLVIPPDTAAANATAAMAFVAAAEAAMLKAGDAPMDMAYFAARGPALTKSRAPPDLMLI
jgi:hypothetical protein